MQQDEKKRLKVVEEKEQCIKIVQKVGKQYTPVEYKVNATTNFLITNILLKNQQQFCTFIAKKDKIVEIYEFQLKYF